MKYPDCASCVFHNVEPAICSECDDADQWEPSEELEDSADTEFRSELREMEAA